jgi:uncharacterized membrane protein/glutaredoxin
MNRKNTLYILTSLLSLIAISLHGYLTWEFFQVKYALSGTSPSFCSLSESFDCSAVAASPYSSFFGIPVALFGLWSNLIFLILFLTYWVQKSFASPSLIFTRFGLNATLGILGLGTLGMGAIALFLMKTYCIFCLATYVLSILVIGLSVYLLKQNQEFSCLMKYVKPAYLIPIIAIPLGSWLTHAIIMDQIGGKRLPLIIQESVLEWKQNPPQTFDLKKGILYGNPQPEAKIVIVEFVDLFCPHCKFASYPLKAFTKARSEVQLVIKLFPLDGGCNDALKESSSKSDGFRCKWSSLLVCAHEQNHGPSVLTWILDKQSDLIKKTFDTGLQELLQEIPFSDQTTLQSCINSENTLAELKAMASEGQKAGIQGTPAIFLNQKLLSRGQLLPILEAASATALEEQK